MKRKVTQKIAKVRKDVNGVMLVMITVVPILSDSASFASSSASFAFRLRDGIEGHV